MKYKVYQKVVVNQPRHETVEFDSFDDCVEWLRTCFKPINYVVIDTETNEWVDGQALFQTDYSKLFSYRT